ncbi:flagellar associated protein [Chrysochromulina tobinii]|uniref:Flagellar associated protein n=1 Tax=Chrysochromulina tobinii TaxID=1460289 RepID=A0A0M0J7U1_9EUKA|nr:flagellar associated protein [Chrysochromulina tobinii]|eukprot:KOO22525.1 flagellar associated protein [Chrysochromulina sp. CCMP291]
MVNTPETAKRVGKAQVDLALVGGELGSLNTGAAVDDDKLALNRCVALEAPWQPQLSLNWAQLSPNSFSNRSKCEWLQCLVRIAILKYVLSKQISEVSRAVEHMFTSKVEALLGSSSSFDANDFRMANCYSEATDAVLLEHFESLKALFETYSLAEGVDFANRQLATVLSSDEWMQLMKDLDFIDQEFTAREAALAFAWSRMRVIDESAGKQSKTKLENLSFEDFCEALVHVALMKAGALDAGIFMMNLKENRAEHTKWLLAHPATWEEPPRQPVHRCLHHLLSLILRTIKARVSKFDVSQQTNLTLDKKEAFAFTALHRAS